MTVNNFATGGSGVSGDINDIAHTFTFSINEDIIGNRNILELTRLCVKNGFGSNIESYAISQSFKWLKKYAPDVKVLISYADPEQNHSGFIYQATNWLYQGQGAFQAAPTYALRLEEDSDWMHSRNVYSRYGSSNVEHLKKQIGHTFWLKKEAENPKRGLDFFTQGDPKTLEALEEAMKKARKSSPKSPKIRRR